MEEVGNVCCMKRFAFNRTHKNIFEINRFDENVAKPSDYKGQRFLVNISNYDRLWISCSAHVENVFEKLVEEFYRDFLAYNRYRKSYQVTGGEKFSIHAGSDFPFYSDILSRATQKDNSNISESIESLQHYDSKFFRSTNSRKSQSSALFSKILIKTTEIVKNNIAYFKQIIDDRNKLIDQNKSEIHSDLTKDHKICSNWVDRMVVLISRLIYKLVKLKPSSHWELVWVTVPIVWLSAFLGSCNLNIRAI